jgi:iron complex outermembrane receptor protein
MPKKILTRHGALGMVLSWTVLTALGSATVHADNPDSAATANTGVPALEEVVVTAQKRSETVQHTALAVTALSADSLAQRDLTTVAAIAQEVPGLNVTEQIGQSRITLRGIGVDNISTGAEGSIAFNQDGVFYSRSSGALASFYDLSRVEVLRGPQGTLYGRNATGGSVNLISAPPTNTPEGYLSLTGGNYKTANTEGAISGPIADNVLGRLSFQTQYHSGYGRNLVTSDGVDSKNSQAVRGQLQFNLSDAFTALVKADYYRADDSSNGYHHLGAAGETATGVPIVPTGLLLGGFVPSDPHDIASGTNPKATAQFYGALVDLRYKINDSVTLRSLSSLRRSEFSLDTDIAPEAVNLFPIYLTENSTQPSQEFQLNVDTTNNKFVAGLFYLHENIVGREVAPFNLLAVGGPNLLTQGFYAGGTLKTDAAAIYGQDSYGFTDRFRLTLGGRFSWEKKAVNDQSDFDLMRPYSPDNSPLVPHHIDSRDFSAFTPKIGVEYDLRSDTLAYASYSKGFKAGTYNLGNASPPLEPEKVSAWEAGLKTTLLDQRLRANLAAFYYDYKDLQVGKVQNLQLILENAATAKIYGIEAEITARPFEAPFLLTLTTSWLHARFDQYVTGDPARPGGDGVTIDPSTGLPAFNLHDKELPQAPNYTANLAGEYTWAGHYGNTTARWETFWSDRVYFSPFDRNEVSQAAYSLSNVFVDFELPNKKWRLSAYLRNAFDKTVFTSGQIATSYIGSPVVGYVAPPRTYGLTVRFSF